jgi:hypothetical protein
MKVISSRDFNQDVSQAKRAARIEPVFVTDRGRTTHVLMSIEAYRKLTGQTETIVDLLAMAAPVPWTSPSPVGRGLGQPLEQARLMYLLDTDIVFELRNAKAGGTDTGPGRPGPPASPGQPVHLGPHPAGTGDRRGAGRAQGQGGGPGPEGLAGRPGRPGLRRADPAGRRRRGPGRGRVP